jgi:hypothetical protein
MLKKASWSATVLMFMFLASSFAVCAEPAKLSPTPL